MSPTDQRNLKTVGLKDGRQAGTTPFCFPHDCLAKNSKSVTPPPQQIHPGLFQIAARVDAILTTQNNSTKRKQVWDNTAQSKRGYSSIACKWTKFQLKAPGAKSVKLAAEFTDWEKFPLDMLKSKTDCWFITVPLAPGNYSYRFIVDNQWWTDSTSTVTASFFEKDHATINVA